MTHTFGTKWPPGAEQSQGNREDAIGQQIISQIAIEPLGGRVGDDDPATDTAQIRS